MTETSSVRLLRDFLMSKGNLVTGSTKTKYTTTRENKSKGLAKYRAISIGLSETPEAEKEAYLITDFSDLANIKLLYCNADGAVLRQHPTKKPIVLNIWHPENCKIEVPVNIFLWEALNAYLKAYMNTAYLQWIVLDSKSLTEAALYKGITSFNELLDYALKECHVLVYSSKGNTTNLLGTIFQFVILEDEKPTGEHYNIVFNSQSGLHYTMFHYEGEETISECTYNFTMKRSKGDNTQ